MEDELKRSQQKIEAIMRQILTEMTQGLRNQSEYHDEFGLLNQLKGTLDYAQEKAARNLDNQFLLLPIIIPSTLICGLYNIEF